MQQDKVEYALIVYYLLGMVLILFFSPFSFVIVFP